jgi:hypothetical protein
MDRITIVIPGRREAANPEPKNTDRDQDARMAARNRPAAVCMGSGFAGCARAPE